MKRYIIDTTILLLILMLIFRENFIFFHILASIQVFLLVYSFIIDKKIHCELLILIAIFSLNNAYYIPSFPNFYAFNNIKIFGIGLQTLISFPIILYIIFNKNVILSILFNNKYKLIKFYILLKVMSIVVGIFYILIKENQIIYLYNNYDIFKLFIEKIYTSIYANISIIFIVLYYLKNTEFKKYKLLIKKILNVHTFFIVFSLIIYRDLVWGGSRVLIVPLSIFYYPFILILLLDKKISIYKKIIYFLCLLAVMIYPNMSKIYIICMILLAFTIVYFIRKDKKNILIFTVGLIILIPLFFIFIDCFKINFNTFKWKFLQIMYLFQIKKEWIEEAPRSLKYRIYEIININSEFIKKTYSFFTGKGLLGTYFDYGEKLRNLTTDEKEVIHASSIIEWKTGVYYTTHETLTLLYLENGLLGIIFLIKISFKFLFNLLKNPYLVVGLLYLFFFTSYSIELMYFGTVFLIGGLKYKSEIIKELK